MMSRPTASSFERTWHASDFYFPRLADPTNFAATKNVRAVRLTAVLPENVEDLDESGRDEYFRWLKNSFGVAAAACDVRLICDGFPVCYSDDAFEHHDGNSFSVFVRLRIRNFRGLRRRRFVPGPIPIR